MIKERRQAMKADPSLGTKGDLLSIMLQDPLFSENDEQIINESITFFLAGTLTQATTVANALCYMIEKPDIEKRVRKSLDKNFTTFSDPSIALEKLAEDLSIESLDLSQDDYLKNVIYETLRIDTPV